MRNPRPRNRPKLPVMRRTEPWAELMAWAQAGDRDAYRRLLTEITPYLRALAQRHHRDAATSRTASRTSC
jgi:hypothetical protein